MSGPQRHGTTAGPVPGTDRLDLADPRALAEVERLELVARGIVEGFLIGLHRSPYRGFSAEFAEHRLYNPGDDLRFVDWKLFARSDRAYIKQYEEETNLRAYLLLDASRSMDWSSDPARLTTKLAYGRLLAASVALLLLRQGDAAGLLAFDQRVHHHLAPRSRRSQWWQLVRLLAEVEGGGGTDAAGAARELSTRLRRRGLAVLISDLLVNPDDTLVALKFLRHAGHEVLIFHLMDPGERELPAAGEAVFFDPESGEELRANSAALRREYREAVARGVEAWRLEAVRMGADYALVTTETPLGLALRRFLDKRSRMP
ncbi:MAG: DUF58 domain-containing protein [Gemmatimonadota bacterium]